ncbi:Cytochrome b subunit of the bc complex [Candidatus Terasakiella magnetica]|nr:Cytochrome b subunit of the bc complex [Candidatus Terasakiella magnetica]
MSNPIKSALRAGLFRVESGWDALVGRESNPMYCLGAMSWLFFWVVGASGLYLFIPYDTSAARAWDSIEYISREQWYWGGVIRSLHRYASDAMVLTMMLHLVREWLLDRYHGARWFAWFTGVPLIWMVFSSGITGYWLVWDELAQYLAIGTAEWLDWLGIFGQSIARNFLNPGALTDRFFTLLIFIHIAVPLFLLFAMWIHILRINRADTNPPRPLVIGTLIMLVGLSLIHPAMSHPPADLGKATAVLNPDWYYMALYPLYDTKGPAVAWMVSIGATLFLSVMPWMAFRRKRRAAAVVSPPNCNACGNCASDCPFGAVVLRPRPSGVAGAAQIAVVQPDLCTSCGMCVASCNRTNPFLKGEPRETGIDLPDFTFDLMVKRLSARTHGLTGNNRVLVLGCEHGAVLDHLKGASVGVLPLHCTGMMPPSLIDYVFNKDLADGVLVTACRPGECFYRLGPEWTEKRMAGERVPKLRGAVPRERVRLFWAASTETKKLATELAEFRVALAELPPMAKPESTKRRVAE